MSRANIFMAASWVGLAGLGIALGAAFLPAADGIVTAGIAIAILSAVVLLWTRRADEFTRSLWSAGASLAFATMLLAFPGIPSAEGFYDGVTGSESGRDIPASIIPVIAIGAFYIGLFVKRLLGDG